MARGTTPSTRQTIVNALRNLFAYLPPPDAPQLAMPAELFERVDFRRMQTPGPRGPISCFVYHPKEGAADPPPVLIYFHGGGWSIGDPAEADLLTRRIALESGAVVVSVDYRLAPEDPYPAGLDDAMAVYRWARQNAATELGAEPARVAVGGDSSGGNLSAAMVLRARDEGLARPDAALLLCPLTDFDCEKYESYQRLAPRGLLYDAAFLGFVRSCLCGATDWRIPYLSPMNGDLAGYCPTCIIAAGEDPLWDENHLFAGKLRAAGNPDVELLEYPKMPHAFYYFLGLADDVDRVHTAMGAFLRRTLTGSRK
jgi:acetyl esterase